MRVLYAAGPGNIIETYKQWADDDREVSSLSVTYSGQFYDVCRRMNAWAHAVDEYRDDERLDDGSIHLRHHPVRFQRTRGLFHLGQTLHALDLVFRAIRWRVDVVIVNGGGGRYFFLLSPLRWLGVAVVPSLHCALWPAGYEPRSPVKRLILRLNGWFWRHAAAATICVSPECERQVRQIACSPRGPFHQVRAQYKPGTFDAVPPIRHRAQEPFRLMFAGRIEHNKGVFFLLDVARRLEQISPGRYQWTFCGDGGASEEFADAVRDQHLTHVVDFPGALDQPGIIQAYGWCHAVVVPTTRDFAEGLNKVAVEAVLCGRPVITSRLSNAIEILGDAIEEVSPDDPDDYQRAIRALACDADRYERRCRAMAHVQKPFYDPSQSWGAAVEVILRRVHDTRYPKQTHMSPE